MYLLYRDSVQILIRIGSAVTILALGVFVGIGAATRRFVARRRDRELPELPEGINMAALVIIFSISDHNLVCTLLVTRPVTNETILI